MAPGLGRGRVTGCYPRRRRRLLSLGVIVGELGQRVALRCGGGDLPVHGREVLALPVLGEVSGRRQLGVAPARDRTNDEGSGRQQGDWNGSGDKSAAALRLGADRAQAGRKLVTGTAE